MTCSMVVHPTIPCDDYVFWKSVPPGLWLGISLIAPAPIDVEGLALFPRPVEGRTSADVIGTAVLHSLEIAALGVTPGSAA